MLTDKMKAAGFRPMSEAPRDGTDIQAIIPGHGWDNVIAWISGYMDADERDCCCWAFTTDQEPPECWTDGVCWASNADEVPSVQPIAWKHLPKDTTHD